MTSVYNKDSVNCLMLIFLMVEILTGFNLNKHNEFKYSLRMGNHQYVCNISGILELKVRNSTIQFA